MSLIKGTVDALAKKATTRYKVLAYRACKQVILLSAMPMDTLFPDPELGLQA